jgi:REP element-mobilizing transposase RayT
VLSREAAASFLARGASPGEHAQEIPEPRSRDRFYMAHTYTLNITHCVFSTKGRLPLILKPSTTWDTLRRVAANGGLHVRAIGGTSNHVHILLELPSTRTIADVLREIKANSSARIRKSIPKFAWQDGYGAISVSPSAVRNVINYIGHQAEHHSKQSFEDEYLSILERAGVKYDPEYVFD